MRTSLRLVGFGIGLLSLASGCAVKAEGDESVGVVSSAVTAAPAPERITAPDGLAYDWFGGAASMSGSRALIGAPYATIDHVSYQGAAYVYELAGGRWVEAAKLVVPDGNADVSGWAVALDGDRAALGAPLALVQGETRGAVFVFERQHGAWQRTATITAPDGALNDEFGVSVGLSGDALLIGAPYAAGKQGAGEGAAYVYRRQAGASGAWREETKLVASDGEAGQGLGYFVSLDGNTAVAGAPFGGPGSARVFSRAAGAWTQAATLSPPASAADASTFGASVSVLGDRILVGAPSDGTSGIANRGAVYEFDHAHHWALKQKLLASDAVAGDSFGMSVAQSDGGVVIGAWLATIHGNASQGSAYAYPINANGGLGKPIKLVAPDGAANDQFGLAVAASGGYVIAGAYAADVGANAQQGAAYSFDMGW